MDLVEQSVHETPGVECDQVVGAFTEADELHWDTELAIDRDDDSAFCRSVEFRKHYPCHRYGVRELPGLSEPVLARGRV